jgi:membrane associated rhomboid family serine protease
MAAAMRFVFAQGGPLASFRGAGQPIHQLPAASLLATLRNPRFLLFLAVWLGLNSLFGSGTVSFGTEAGQQIAWQAHVGGFFAGLFLFDAFDPSVPQAELDTEASS